MPQPDVIEDLGTPGHAVFVAVSGLAIGSSFRCDGPYSDRVDRLVGLGRAWPPIVLGRSRGSVIDGAHPVAAAPELGLARIEAIPFGDGPEEAFVEFVRGNVTHRLMPSLRERKRAAVRVLRRHGTWSVAGLCAVSPKIMARLRRSAEACPTGAGVHTDSGVRQDRDFRVRPVRRRSARGRIVEALRAHTEAAQEARVEETETRLAVRRHPGGRTPRSRPALMRTNGEADVRQVAEVGLESCHSFL